MAMKKVCTVSDAHSTPILCVAFDGCRNEIYSGGRDCLIKVSVPSLKGLNVPQNKFIVCLLHFITLLINISTLYLAKHMLHIWSGWFIYHHSPLSC